MKKNKDQALKDLNFKWLPKHIQHIAENIVFKKRNISFLSINALFRQKNTYSTKPSELGNDHYVIEDFVPLSPNDRLRIRAENLRAVFTLDDHNNIIVVTAISEKDKRNDEY
jgi:mRNA-degrading endonuclease RelE of RelBE toxin-antitoxin system